MATVSKTPPVHMKGRTRRKRVDWHAVTRSVGLGAIIGAVALLTLGLVAYAAAASYESVSHLAATRGVPLARLNPLGIDGGLLAVIVLDIALTAWGHPVSWLRFTGRLFAVGTIAANIAAGWPDPAGVGLRIAAPVLFIVIVEAARHVLLHRDDEPGIDRIPRMRWLLDFRGTYALWRRMRLWDERSYAAAIGMELERLDAIEKLVMKYGADTWMSEAPANLVWMLRAGVRMSEALARVAELTKPEPVAVPVTGAGSGTRKRAASGRKRTRKPTGNGVGNRARKSAASAPEVAAVTAPEGTPDGAREALVLKYVAEGKSASEAGRLAGLSDSRGRQIVRDRTVVPMERRA